MAVTPKTMLRKPLPASRGPANKTAVPHAPPAKDGKKQHSSPKDLSVRPAKVQPLQGGANISDTNHPRYQQRSSAPFESQLNATKIPLTVRSHSLSESPQKRPVIRKGPIVPSKAKTVPKFTLKHPSARYQSLPHSHHKNVTSKPVTGHLRDSNSTTGSAGISVSPIPQRTATIPLKNSIKSGQKGTPFPPDRVKQFPVALQAVTQMGRQLKEKSSNTSVLLNTLVNQNSSFLTNSLQHMAQSSNSTFTTGKEAVLYELNSLNTQDHLLNVENVTSVPQADRHNDVSRAGLLRKINWPEVHDSKVMQELKSKVNVKIPDRNIFMNTNLSSTELSGLVQEDRGQFHPVLTTDTSVIGLTQTVVLATQTARTSDNVSHSSVRSQGLVETTTEVHSRLMTGEATQAKREKDQTWPGMTESHQIHHNLTHSHKHRHLNPESLRQNETNTISQHKGAPHDRTAPSEPNRHHQKHLHNHTQPHSHSHHKHHSDHRLQRNHVSQTLVTINTQEQPDLTTRMQLNQSNPQQLHKELVTSTQRQISIQNDTHFSARLSDPSYIGGMQENEIGSVTAGLSGISGTAHPRLTTQNVFGSQSELTTQSQEPTTYFSVSVTDSQTAVHKLNSLEQGRHSEAYPSLHTKPFIHRLSESHTQYHLTQTTKYNVTTHLHVAATKQPQLDIIPTTLVESIIQNQPGNRPSQEELTTPTQEQQTIKNQTNLTFLDPSKLSTSEVGLTTQTQPKVITQTQPELSTEHDFSTRAWQTRSTQKPPKLTIKVPLMPPTVTMPYLITPSQPEPTRNNLSNSRTLAYVNKTQPEPITNTHSKGNDRTEFSTNTGPNINNALESTSQTKSIQNSPMELGNYTEPITNTKSPTQRELFTKTGAVFPTVPELITKVTTESTNNTEPFLQGETKTDSQVEPVTKHRNDSTAQNEPASRRDSTTKHKPTTASKTHPTIKSEWATDEIDTQKHTTSTTNTHTESAAETEPITNRKIESTTQSTTKNLTDFTDTEPITKHMAELDTKREPTTANKMESFTQTNIMIHGGGKKEPAIQIETGLINQTELIPKTSFKPTVSYPHVSTSHKGLMQSTQSHVGTPTYHQLITLTGPELTMNVNDETNIQTPGDQAVDKYTPTERTSFTDHVNVTENRTEGPAPARTGGHHGYTQNGVHYSKTTPVWDVEAYHPTSRLPSGHHQDHAIKVKNDGSESPSSTKSVTSPQSSTFTPLTLSEMMSSPSGRDRIFIVDEQQPVFKVPTISMTYRVNVQQSAMCSDLEPCKKDFSKEVTSAYKYTAGFDKADVINVTLSGTALEYKVQYSVQVGSPMSVEQESVLANPTSVFEALAPSEYTLLSTIRNTSMEDMVEPCTDWFTCPRGFRCVPQRKLSAFCLSPCHSTFCQNDGICIHRKGQDPACQCPVGRDFWYMGPACDYRMTHHRLAAIACAVVFCIIICAAAAVFILVRRFQTQILQQKVAQTQSSYRRFSRFDDVPTHFWCPSQTWLTTSASINSLDNPAFSSSEEVFPLQALGSCVCGCQDGARNNAPTNPAQQPPRAPPSSTLAGPTLISREWSWSTQSGAGPHR
ncbi:unnamed protein product, partial [Staurois parvus]